MNPRRASSRSAGNGGFTPRAGVRHAVRVLLPLSAATCLDEFFADRRRGSAGRRLARIERTEDVLRAAVERMSELVLTDAEQTLVAYERQFQPVGAVARILPAAGLLLVLEAHLAALEEHPSRSAARRVELDLCGQLARHLTRELQHLDVQRAAHRIELALQECTAWADRGPAGLLRRALGR